ADHAWMSILGFLGAEELRDPAQVPAAERERMPRLSASRVRVLRQVAGSRIRWRLALGATPHLRFTPLAPERSCDITLEVSVAAPGRQPRPLHRQPVPRRHQPAPAAVTLDLSAWSGREIELRFAVAPAVGPAEGGGECVALWASPQVWSRARAPGEPAVRAAPARPNVLLIGADTLRADALGAYGRRPSPTPALDALAADADLWLHAHATFNVTNPSFASILTGLYGKEHGVYDLKTPLPQAVTTLAELFAAAGYATHAVLSAQHLGPHNSGLDQGFAAMQLATGTSAAELAVEQAIDWLEQPRDDPFLLWLHLFDPHTPHSPPRPFADGMRPAHPPGIEPVWGWSPFRPPGPRAPDEPFLAGERDLYLGEVAYLDRQVGRLLAYLGSRGLLASTVVAFVADHGENLGEHGVLYRHAGLWDTTTHVPLMVRWPGPPRRGRRLGGLVQTHDLFPTLLNAAGIDPPPSSARDLRQLTGRGRSGRQAVFSEHADGIGASVRTRRFRYTELAEGGLVAAGTYLYDLHLDPGEAANLAGSGHPEETRLAALLARWRAGATPAAPARNLSDEEAAQLRALGY
ncbi:MAG TPA: sulfatase, partial [Thermoanaerobaculia bacterium]|nr:sulfatase [Thermoanaerobaculia bacterium]